MALALSGQATYYEQGDFVQVVVYVHDSGVNQPRKVASGSVVLKQGSAVIDVSPNIDWRMGNADGSIRVLFLNPQHSANLSVTVAFETAEGSLAGDYPVSLESPEQNRQLQENA